MKKILVLCVCLAVFGMGLSSAIAAESTAPAGKTSTTKAATHAGDPIEQLTGKIWMESSDDIKAAFLYGIDCAVSIEHGIAKRLKEITKADGKKKSQPNGPSPFVQTWTEAFENVPRAEIIENIDTWYAKNPDKQQRPVFDVIWYELIVPKTKK